VSGDSIDKFNRDPKDICEIVGERRRFRRCPQGSEGHGNMYSFLRFQEGPPANPRAPLRTPLKKLVLASRTAAATRGCLRGIQARTDFFSGVLRVAVKLNNIQGIVWKNPHARLILYSPIYNAILMHASSPIHGRRIEALTSAPELPHGRNSPARC
jgi:hypothetical protein